MVYLLFYPIMKLSKVTILAHSFILSFIPYFIETASVLLQMLIYFLTYVNLSRNITL